MDEFLKIAAICTVGAMLSAFLRKSRPDFAFCIGALTIALAACLAFSFFSPIVSFLKRLQKLADVSDTAITPVLKTVAIGLLTQLAGSFCTDAGETALAKLTELCGSVMAVFCALPLCEAVLHLVQSLMGG